MIYNPDKFPYKELKRENLNGSRRYITPDGKPVPSVTTILSATKSEESKQALLNWRKRIGEKAAQEIVTEAAGRGTRLHKWLENYVKNGVLGEAGSNPYSVQSHKMASVMVDKALKHCNEFWGTEISLYFPLVYAGTTDLVGVHNNVECIMDYKQTNKPKKREYIEDYFLQLVAYANAHNEVYNTKIRKGVVFMCSKDYEYQEFCIEDDEFDKYTDLWFKKLEEYYIKYS